MASFMPLCLPAQRYELSSTQPSRLGVPCRAAFGGLRKTGVRAVRQRGGPLRALEGAAGESSNIIDIDSAEQFDAVISGNPGKLIILDAGASWCGPCKLFKPTYVQFAEKYTANGAIFLTCTGDKNPSTASIMKRLAIKNVPAFHFFKDGEQIHKFSGANKENFRDNLKLHLAGVADD